MAVSRTMAVDFVLQITHEIVNGLNYWFVRDQLKLWFINGSCVKMMVRVSRTMAV